MTPLKPNFSRQKLNPKMRTLVDAVSRPVPPADGLKIVGATFQGINIETSPALLLDSKESFYGHKDIIFAGFCAWLTDSSDYHSSADAVALATADMIVAAESSKRLQKVPVHHRYLMQTEADYRPLFNQVYYNIGGLASLMKASGPLLCLPLPYIWDRSEQHEVYHPCPDQRPR